MAKVPPCEYRVETETPDRYYCRQTGVHALHNLVTQPICNGCRQRVRECADPRPVPKLEELANPPPPLVRQAWNLAKSLASFAADGFRTVTPERYATRLQVCDGCDQRRGNRCRQCGCSLSLKARGRAFRCPLGKWSEQDA